MKVSGPWGCCLDHTYQNRRESNTPFGRKPEPSCMASRHVLTFLPEMFGVFCGRHRGKALIVEKRAPVFFFAPFVSSTMRVEPAWIDYNGHMNMAYYHVLFDRAVDEGFGVVGLGQDYLEGRNASYFAAEVHTLYRRELTLGDKARVTLQLIDFD